MTHRLWRYALVLTLLIFAVSATAQDTATTPRAATESAGKPLWEAGIAAGIGTTADYPGSDRYQLRVIPFPYFVYRGNFFRSDQNGTRLRAAASRDLEFEISGGASFATHSSGSGPRAGMPDLDYLLELGPKVKYTFARPAPATAAFAEVPLRAVISTNGRRLDYRGLVFAPDVGIRTSSLLGSAWTAYADVGPEFATARFHDYFYEVAPQYATATRPAYDAHGGYFGSRLEVGFSRPLGRHFRVFIYQRLEDYTGARNTGSPLLQTRLGYAGFVGFSWSFLHSEEMVSTSN